MGLLICALTAALVSGCAGDADPAAAPTTAVPTATSAGGPARGHTHGTTVGDGTRASAHGYTMTSVSLPRRAGVPGEVSFRIEDRHGRPVTRLRDDQTKKLHLYVVRTDYQVYRHLHPTLITSGPGKGSWSTMATLSEPGRYRVIAAVTPVQSRRHVHQVVLGAEGVVPGRWHPAQATASAVGDDGFVTVSLLGEPMTGRTGAMALVVRDALGQPIELGTYLGSYAHVTAFHVASGALLHAHPLAQPAVSEDGSQLNFHTQFVKAGNYIAFVQVRVGGLLHTLRMTIPVKAKPVFSGIA